MLILTVFWNGKELGDESYPNLAEVPALPGDWVHWQPHLWRTELQTTRVV